MKVGADVRADILDSLAQGDHIGRVSVSRALVGLLLLHLYALGKAWYTRDAQASRGTVADVVILVANPIAHGARLATAVRRAATRAGLSVTTIADGRIAGPGLKVDVHFPGIGVRSVLSLADIPGLRWGWSVFRGAESWPAQVSKNRWVRAYLVLAQTLRYRAAFDQVGDLPATVCHVADFDRAAYSRPWCWAVKAHGGTLCTLVHGSPSEATYVPFIAPWVLVWGDIQKRFVQRAGAIPVVVGRPEIPSAVRGRGAPTAVVCHSMEDLSEAEVDRLQRAIQDLRASGYRITLKPHPRSVGVQLKGRGWPRVALLSDALAMDGQPLLSLLGNDDVVVTITSTAAADAIALGLAAFVLGDSDRRLSCDLEAIRTWNGGRSVIDSVRPDSSLFSLRDALVAGTGGDAEILMGRVLRELVGRARTKAAGRSTEPNS